MTSPFSPSAEARLLTQVQGRTYALLFGLVERFINAKILEMSRDHWLGNQTALQALVRFSDEELKHQELFRTDRGDGRGGHARRAIGPRRTRMPSLSSFSASRPGRCSRLTCFIELFSQKHYVESIDTEKDVSPLWKDVFMYHWREEAQHAMLDELEWQREDAKLTPAQRDQRRH